jgi:hypothetical protein
VRAQINTTGFVDRDRYAVAIFSRGPTSLYYRAGERIVSDEARAIAPNGHLTPQPTPIVRRLTRTSGPSSGGQRLTIVGLHFRDIRAVHFGARKARITSAGERRLHVIVPTHRRGVVAVRVTGAYGRSAKTAADRYRFGHSGPRTTARTVGA